MTLAARLPPAARHGPSGGRKAEPSGGGADPRAVARGGRFRHPGPAGDGLALGRRRRSTASATSRPTAWPPHASCATSTCGSCGSWRWAALLNFIAIAANGGVMPARAGALRAAGLDASSGDFANSDLVHNAHVGFLGDVFAIPDGWPGANVFSVGDAVMLLGAFLVLHAATGSRLFAAREERRPREQAVPTAPAPPVPRAR